MQNLNERLTEMTSKLKQNVSNLQQNLSENRKKSIILGSLTGALLIGSSFGLYYYQANAATLYHVYADGKYIGTVNDKNVIEQWKNNELTKVKTTYDVSSLEATKKITYQEDTVFKGEFNNEGTLKKLNGIFEVQAVGTAIVVNGKQIGVVKDQATAERILEAIKKGYTPNTDKSKVKAASVSNDSKTKVESVTLKERVETSSVKTSPSDILAEQDILRLIKQGTLEQKKYKVQDGDTISDIANKHGLTTNQLYQLNPGLSGELIHIGDDLNVTAMKPLVTVQVKETVVAKESIPYPTEYQENSSMYKGQTRTSQTGKDGSKTVTYEITSENGVTVQKKALSETINTQPVKQIVQRGTKVAPSRGSGTLVWPTYGGSISSPYGGRWGRMHDGIDIIGGNHVIRAADSGVVSFAGWKNGYGLATIINHNNGMQTLYGHQSKINVSVGQRVDKGQSIGVMGNTGRSTGTHLHFEVHVGGGTRNPLNYVRR